MKELIKRAFIKNIQWKKVVKNYQRYYIWGDKVPNYNKLIPQQKPSIMFFRAKNTVKKRGCVIIIPGGFYLYESTNEAQNIAEKISKSGINAAVLSYRLYPYPRDVILSDAKRAIKYLKCYANAFNIDKDAIGVLGFSAGGNLAMLSALNQDEQDDTKEDKIDAQSSKIAALGLCYAAVYQDEESMNFDDPRARKYFKVEMDKKPKDFPPTFIWNSFKDNVVDYNVAMKMANKLASYDIPVELHMFPYGSHGQGLADTQKGEINQGDNKLTSCWSDLYIRWLNFYGF